MKINEVPQDGPEDNEFDSTLLKYAVDDNGNFVPTASNGWEDSHSSIKTIKEEFRELAEEALEKIKKNKTSPVEYFMYKSLMDIDILSSMVSFSKRKVKKHMDPKVFEKLSDEILSEYAALFLIDVETIKNFKKELS